MQVLGSLSLLFNPTGLVRSVRAGVSDFVGLPLAALQNQSLSEVCAALCCVMYSDAPCCGGVLLHRSTKFLCQPTPHQRTQPRCCCAPAPAATTARHAWRSCCCSFDWPSCCNDCAPSPCPTPTRSSSLALVWDLCPL